MFPKFRKIIRKQGNLQAKQNLVERKQVKQMGWLSTVLALIQLAPSILQLIAQVETIFGAGNGAMKKQIVMAPLAAAPQSVQDQASKFIDNTVAAANQVGAMGKSQGSGISVNTAPK